MKRKIPSEVRRTYQSPPPQTPESAEIRQILKSSDLLSVQSYIGVFVLLVLSYSFSLFFLQSSLPLPFHQVKIPNQARLLFPPIPPFFFFPPGNASALLNSPALIQTIPAPCYRLDCWRDTRYRFDDGSIDDGLNLED